MGVADHCGVRMFFSVSDYIGRDGVLTNDQQ